MNKTKTALKIVVFAAYFVALAAVAGKLFFESRFDATVSSVKNIWATPAAQYLVIGYSEPLISMNPFSNDVGSKARLMHIYEGLVRANADLKIQPALAISYGYIDNLTWEFRLRPDVFFHNGGRLTVDDVIASLQEALPSTIKEIKKMDSGTFRIITRETDPLLLARLSQIFIFKKSDGQFVGTGPYDLKSKDGGLLTLKRFKDYWGDRPAFETVTLKTFASKKEKINALENETVDIVANVPTDVAKDFNYEGFNLRVKPSLESNFLMFNFDKIFKDKNLREAVALSLNTDELVDLTQGFLSPISQFVGNGIFGYDPAISPRTSDVDRAKELVGSTTVKAEFDLPKGLEILGTNVKKQLKTIGIDVNLHFLAQSDFGKKTDSDFYFFGWRSELGDSGDFLASVAHSRAGSLGQFNNGDYSNPDADRLIELSQKTLDEKMRLEYLRQAMRIITQDDAMGVPLFAPEVLYGVSKRLDWSPRVDGYVLAQEVKM